MRRCVSREIEIFPEPLFHEHPIRRCGEADDEAGEPQDVDADRPSRSHELGERGVGVGGVQEAIRHRVVLGEHLLEEKYHLVFRIGLEELVGFDDERGEDGGVQTSLALRISWVIINSDKTHEDEKRVDVLLVVFDFFFVVVPHGLRHCGPPAAFRVAYFDELDVILFQKSM